MNERLHPNKLVIPGSEGAGQDALPYSSFDSRQFPASERFEATRQSVMPLCRIEPTAKSLEQNFDIHIEGWNLNGLLIGINRVSTGGARILRKCRELSQGVGGDPFQLFIFHHGDIAGDIDGHEVIVRSGDVGLVDLGRPVDVVHSGSSEHTTLLIPRERLLSRLDRPGLPATVVLPRDWVLTQLFVHHVEAVVQMLPYARVDEGAVMADGLLDLLVSTLNPIIRRSTPHGGAVDRAVMRAVCDFIENQLSSPSLSVQMICARFRCSRAHLYRLFKPYGGVQHYIRERRLIRCCHQLSAREQRHLSVTAIAMQNGFINHSHFCRLFKERFGISPGQAREQTIEFALPQERGVATAYAKPAFYHWFCEL